MVYNVVAGILISLSDISP